METDAMLGKDATSIPSLFGDVAEQIGHLVGIEVRLAKAELSEKIEDARRGLTYVVAAGVMFIPAVVMALIAFAIWLSKMGIAPALAYLITAIIGGALSAVLLFSGLSKLKLKRLKPKETIRQVNQDVAAVRNIAK